MDTKEERPDKNFLNPVEVVKEEITFKSMVSRFGKIRSRIRCLLLPETYRIPY